MLALLLVLVLVLALVGVGVALTRTVREDGLGHRPPPSSPVRVPEEVRR